jgi:Cu-Zn family superoxide dismutase
MIGRLACTAMFVALGSGCTVGDLRPEQPPEQTKRATATLESRSASTVTGNATFTSSNGRVTLVLTVAGASVGSHGVHLHAVPDCSAADATSAQGHWNPDMMNHGLPVTSPHHLGDCGNFDVVTGGTGTLTITKEEWTIGTGDVTDVAGHALIVHAAMDDGVTQNPPGNAGARQACGVVTVQ